MEIFAQSSTAFVLTHNFQGTHILGASRGRLSGSVASCTTTDGHLISSCNLLTISSVVVMIEHFDECRLASGK